jgi:hypothetical protein
VRVLRDSLLYLISSSPTPQGAAAVSLILLVYWTRRLSTGKGEPVQEYTGVRLYNGGVYMRGGTSLSILTSKRNVVLAVNARKVITR